MFRSDKKLSDRQSNFELMKIICILFIIFGHLILGTSSHTDVFSHNIYIFLMAILLIHVNAFVMNTGYFQCTKKFNFTKLIAINNVTWFYKSVICLILIFCGIISVGNFDLIKILSPVNFLDYANYWFITDYMLLYFISPILNIVIKNIDEKKHRLIIISLVFAFIILPSIFGPSFYDNNSGYSLINFIVLYFLGLLLILIGVVGLSYSFFSKGGKQELANTFKSGCLNIGIKEEGSAINLDKTYPMRVWKVRAS